MRLSTGRARSDEGFTLVELLVATVVLGMLMSVLTGAFVLVLRSTGETSDQLVATQGARLVANYFQTDVQSADEVAAPDPAGCGGGAVVTLRWADDRAADQVASYAVVVAPSGERSLVRRHCHGATTVDTVTLVAPLGADPVVTCTPDCSAPRTVRLRAGDPDGFAYEVETTRRTT